jgi:hypothetical protein
MIEEEEGKKNQGFPNTKAIFSNYMFPFLFA